MIVQPLIRNNICLTSHPQGCAALVAEQIAFAKRAYKNVPADSGPKLALVIGSSTGYGLASRIAAAYGYHAATVGVSFEKAGGEAKTGTPGWYNNLAFQAAADKARLPAATVDADAFSDQAKAMAMEAIKTVAARAGIKPEVDLVVYSIASPVRTDPDTGIQYRSVIKAIGTPYSGLALDFMDGTLSPMTVEAASQEEIDATVKVMGGEDWARWIKALSEAGLLAKTVRTVAYTYIGPELSWPIYRDGTIGRAKSHLEKTAQELNDSLKPAGGGAWVSVNKALVTRSSAVIPAISLYIAFLFKEMKAAGIHEDCAEQILRLFRDRLYTPSSAAKAALVKTDQASRIRLDDLELRHDIQTAVSAYMAKAAARSQTAIATADIDGIRNAFLRTHGFAVSGIDYQADIDPSGI